jgi:hypothetical protein
MEPADRAPAHPTDRGAANLIPSIAAIKGWLMPVHAERSTNRTRPPPHIVQRRRRFASGIMQPPPSLRIASFTGQVTLWRQFPQVIVSGRSSRPIRAMVATVLGQE